MKGVIAGKPGIAEIVEFPDPKLAPGEVLLSSLACGICSTDVKAIQKGADGSHFALGHELVGTIIETGPESSWQPGARVVAAPYLPCGVCTFCFHNQPTLCTQLFQSHLDPGGLAERVRIPRDLAQRGLLPVPDSLPDEVASLAEPMGCVIKGTEDCQLKAGDSLLVVGDGPMGVLGAAVGRAMGAYPVIVAGMTPHRLKVAQEHYADFIIDIRQEPLVPAVKRYTAGLGADCVLAAVSSGEALASAIDSVRPGGVVNAFAGVPEGTTIPLDVRRLHYQQIHLTGSFGVGPVHLQRALDLLSSGRVATSPLITAQFSFDRAQEALNYAANRVGLKAVVKFNAKG